MVECFLYEFNARKNDRDNLLPENFSKKKKKSLKSIGRSRGSGGGVSNKNKYKNLAIFHPTMSAAFLPPNSPNELYRAFLSLIVCIKQKKSTIQ